MSSESSTKYTAMYNTFKTYCHGKNIDDIYDKELYKEYNDKYKTEFNFNSPITIGNSQNFEKFNKTEVDIKNSNSNILFNSSESKNNNIENNNIQNINQRYEMNNGPMPQITEDDRENEETMFNEEPKYYDEYDEQYVKYIYLFFLEKYNMLELQNYICGRKYMGKSYMSKM